MTDILICGIGGKMGRAVLAQAQEDGEFRVAAGVDKAVPAGLPCPVFPSFRACDVIPDVIVDFSRPEALADMADFAEAHSIPVVIASTGYDEAQNARIAELAQKVPVFQSFNMSLGLNLLSSFVGKAAEFFGEAFDIEIVEKHHNMKVDAPSGTALMLADAANAAFEDKKPYLFGRHGTDAKRKNEIGIHAVRGGTIVGEHEVMFLGPNEYVTLTHTATSREIFARGALRAALFLRGRPAGKYDMQDVISPQYAVHTFRTLPAQALVHLEGAGEASALFALLAGAGLNLDLISQTFGPSGGTVSFTLPEADLPRAEAALKEQGLTFSAFPRLCKLVVEGMGMTREKGVAAALLKVFREADIRIYLITSGETEISLLVEDGAEDGALALLKEQFGQA